MKTSAQLRLLAARERALAEEAHLEFVLHRANAELLERTADEKDRLAKIADKGHAIRDMHPSSKRRVGKPTTSRHPFAVALAGNGSNVAEWARLHNVPRETAQSWVNRAPRNRPIPQHWADAILAELGVPIAAWGDKIR